MQYFTVNTAAEVLDQINCPQWVHVLRNYWFAANCCKKEFENRKKVTHQLTSVLREQFNSIFLAQDFVVKSTMMVAVVKLSKKLVQAVTGVVKVMCTLIGNR